MISHKFITLGELMKRVNAPLFIQMGGVCGEVRGRSDMMNSPERLTAVEVQAKQFLHPMLKEAELQCHALALVASESMMQRCIHLLNQPGLTKGHLADLLRDLLSRIEDETQARLWYVIDHDKQHLATETNLFGDKVAKRFPSTSYDIEEAGNCLAFDHWTAAVFHLGRIAESATVTIGKRVGYSSPLPSFAQVLGYMDGQLAKAREKRDEANPLFVGDLEFLSTVTAQMHAVNNAWRKQVAHLDKKYNEAEALRIWNTTKALLEQMAEKLEETGTDA